MEHKIEKNIFRRDKKEIYFPKKIISKFNQLSETVSKIWSSSEETNGAREKYLFSLGVQIHNNPSLSSFLVQNIEGFKYCCLFNMEFIALVNKHSNRKRYGHTYNPSLDNLAPELLNELNLFFKSNQKPLLIQIFSILNLTSPDRTFSSEKTGRPTDDELKGPPIFMEDNGTGYYFHGYNCGLEYGKNSKILYYLMNNPNRKNGVDYEILDPEMEIEGDKNSFQEIIPKDYHDKIKKRLIELNEKRGDAGLTEEEEKEIEIIGEELSKSTYKGKSRMFTTTQKKHLNTVYIRIKRAIQEISNHELRALLSDNISIKFGRIRSRI